MKKQQHLKSIIVRNICFSILFVAVLFVTDIVNAQMFEEQVYEQNNVAADTVQEPKQVFQPSRRIVNPNLKSGQAWNNKPTSQTKKEPTVSVRKVEEIQQADPDDKIYMYYRDFKINRGFTKMISCSVRFYIYSTVKEKITSISYRLKWPNMETVLNFDDVKPNTPTYYDYALLGKGCYEMDAVPNIIVNRCRIKGKSQKYCSSIIQWTK